MSKFGKRLIESAEQALVFAECESETKDYLIHLPEKIDVKNIRKGMEMSQGEFANFFGFSVRTLQQWEQGRSEPRGVAKNFLLVLKDQPELVRNTLLNI